MTTAASFVMTTPEDDDEPLRRLVAHYKRLEGERTVERDLARGLAVTLEQRLGRIEEILAESHKPIAFRVHDIEAVLRGDT